MIRRIDTLVIGGGFYGAYIAEHLAKAGKRVLICEREPQLMTRASFNNQARVHNGYHYPRSTVTALRSHVSFPRFVDEFRDAIDADFDKYYMIGKLLGHVSAAQFQSFCTRIGIPCQPSSGTIAKLTNPRLIEACFRTKEVAFNSNVLCRMMADRIREAGVEVQFDTKVRQISRDGNILAAEIQTQDGVETVQCLQVFNCTYSMINHVNERSALPAIPLKHELTEICLVDVPPEFERIGLTVMCGPFFSVMPFPAADGHSFSHVRYTPHFEWRDFPDGPVDSTTAEKPSLGASTAWRKMKLDAARYIPKLAECRYRSSLWEVKTILPTREIDDGRPILFNMNHGLRGYHCVMGGKIDNVYDIIETLQRERLDQ